MAFLTPTEIRSHLYGEVVNEIARDDYSILQTAIDAALAELISYLTAYDINAIMAAEGPARNAILLLYCKDIAVWHYIQLANPGVEMDLRLTRYEKAIEFLKQIQSGKANPNLPLPAPPEGTTNGESFIKWGSESKRNNYY